MVLERGDISFFWRPRVRGVEERRAPRGIQSLHMLMSPEGGPHRRVRIGRNRLHGPRGARFWAQVERVGGLERVIGDLMEGERYATKTRGERYQPPAEPVGTGAYALVRHDEHTHLVYRLWSREPGAEIDVPEAGSFVLLYEAAPGARATWCAEGDARCLDRQGTEIVLVAIGREVVDDAVLRPA